MIDIYTHKYYAGKKYGNTISLQFKDIDTYYKMWIVDVMITIGNALHAADLIRLIYTY